MTLALDPRKFARYPLAHRAYPYARHPDQDRAPVRHPVVIAGAGPVGLVLGLDLALKGVRVLILDDHEGIGMGSRAICFSKRSMEILHRLGCGVPVAEQGVVWNLGKVFHRDAQIYTFNLLPEGGHRFPAFVNLQQPAFERIVLDRIRSLQAEGLPLEIRGANRVEAVAQHPDHAALTVETPEGAYGVEADWLVACDGAGSPIRGMLDLGFEGEVFKDSFLIADVRMKAQFPTERWFWFDPPSGAGASQLLHRQPDDVWRIDFQIGWDADRAEELKPENVRRRVTAMLGEGVDFEIVWNSIYTFQCRRMRRFRSGRTIFAGDSAHQVSPFGARGANSGVQDAENLAWKLALILKGAPDGPLLDSYEAERIQAADENIRNSTRSTDFIAPKSAVRRAFRDAVLSLSARHAFARPLVNSGRLSVPCIHDGSPLNGPDALPGAPARSRPGAPAPDAAFRDWFLLDVLGGEFQLLFINIDVPHEVALGVSSIHAQTKDSPELAERWLGSAPAGVYLIRPDQHVVARWAGYDPAAVRAALARAKGGVA